MLHALAALPRRIRWALRKWSAGADRDFHDALFAAQRYDPFSFAYPGYVTIRRFADLTTRHLTDSRTAVDLGCGPGEITCELARQHPHVHFTGVDHSASAIERANAHKQALVLTNVTFVCADVSTFPLEDVDIVLMYDSFHHLLDPQAFVRRVAPKVSRFLLVEPAGDWLGGSQRTLEFDWILSAIDAIRSRLVWQMNDGGAADRPRPAPGADDRGEPVEHRYTVGDLKHFFDGYGLEIEGTIAGMDQYPPEPYLELPLREDFGRLAFHAVTEIDEILRRRDLDLHAKHWVVYAERGRRDHLRVPAPVNPRLSVPDLRLQGEYDVEYLHCEAASSVTAGTTFPVTLTMRNGGWRPWRSDDDTAPVYASYHWLDAAGAMLIEDGTRSPLPRPLAPGETLTMTCTVHAPEAPGRCTLAIDLVEEGVTWFSRAGAPLLRRSVTVKSRA
jgi:SAM-dependent methyltransferase